jgi:hypothetical protein
MADLLVCAGVVVTITTPGFNPASPWTFEEAPSDKVFIDGNGAYFGDVTVKFAGSVGSYSGNGEVTIHASGEKVLGDGENALLSSDSGSDTFTFHDSDGDPLQVEVVAVISDPGQNSTFYI